SASAAAATMRGSVSKSGKPWAKLIARSGPLSSRLSRVISRMTDSAKLCALSESLARWLMSWIAALQVHVGARAGVAALGHLQTTLPVTAHVADPPGGGEELEDVRTA